MGDPGYGREAVIREIQSMSPPGFAYGYQVAKTILALSNAPPDGEGPYKKIGPRSIRRPMSRAEARRIVDAALARMSAVDEGD